MKNTISRKYIVNHIVGNYGEMRHDADRMVKALRVTAKAYEVNVKDLFHYIIERSNTIPMATSYGFDTAYGREIRQSFENNYYKN
jgi:hypothetical protein